MHREYYYCAEAMGATVLSDEAYSQSNTQRSIINMLTTVIGCKDQEDDMKLVTRVAECTSLVHEQHS